jgi:2-succinyl-6-hydroxy-2,4-cyclohexadiene-1-carboxylate synthase
VKNSPIKVLALHGNLGAPSDWSALEGSVELSSWTKPCLWDFLKENPQLDLLEVGRWLAEDIEQNKYDLLIGYSLGGRLLLHALEALKSSEQKCILISTNLAIPEKDAEARILWDEKWSEKIINSDQQTFLDQWNSLPTFASDSKKEFIADLAKYREEISLAFKNWSLGKQDFDSFSLMQIPSKISLVTGERDLKCTENNHYWGKYIERAEHITINDAGHRLLETHVEFLSSLIQKARHF